MGCDIHLYVEQQNDLGEWHEVSPEGKVEQEDWEKEHGYWHWYSGRNYDLFAMLANVRNGHGFAGCDTGDGFRPICMPKGLPDDCDESIRAISDDWGTDGHSHSWLTVAELIAYDWNQITKMRGWVDPLEYAKWKEAGKGGPESYSGGVSGGGVKHVTNEEMEALIEQKGPEPTEFYSNGMPKRTHFTQVEWIETYAEAASWFLKKTLPVLKKLGDPQKTRIVFWFDN